MYDILHFLQFLRSEIIRTPVNERNLENFYFYFFLLSREF